MRASNEHEERPRGFGGCVRWEAHRIEPPSRETAPTGWDYAWNQVAQPNERYPAFGAKFSAVWSRGRVVDHGLDARIKVAGERIEHVLPGRSGGWGSVARPAFRLESLDPESGAIRGEHGGPG